MNTLRTLKTIKSRNFNFKRQNRNICDCNKKSGSIATFFNIYIVCIAIYTLGEGTINYLFEEPKRYNVIECEYE